MVARGWPACWINWQWNAGCQAITVDSGPGAQGRVFGQWAYENGVRLQLSRPGKPVENAHIESFNARFREECPNEAVFMNLADARNKTER